VNQTYNDIGWFLPIKSTIKIPTGKMTAEKKVKERKMITKDHTYCKSSNLPSRGPRLS